jgi:hypothetical protein
MHRARRIKGIFCFTECRYWALDLKEWALTPGGSVDVVESTRDEEGICFARLRLLALSLFGEPMELLPAIKSLSSSAELVGHVSSYTTLLSWVGDGADSSFKWSMIKITKYCKSRLPSVRPWL